ncbi:MAG: 30S ribosomal protein S17e [Thermoplasmatales archaeon]|nr:30S ribosomal protein S17e [Thermoplasmatales archaeon]
MGNIKQTHIKNVAIYLVKEHPDQFKHDDFQHNKEKVEELVEVSSKLMRNKIAGYITRYLASRNKGRNNRPISE